MKLLYHINILLIKDNKKSPRMASYLIYFLSSCLVTIAHNIIIAIVIIITASNQKPSEAKTIAITPNSKSKQI